MSTRLIPFAVTNRTMTELDDQIAQRRKELEYHPLEDAARARALFNLAVSLENRFLEGDSIGDIEEAIGLHQAALALRPVGHPQRHQSLVRLAWCLHIRYGKQDTLPDLEEAIMLARAALDLSPTGHPGRSSSLNNLASSLHERYRKLASIADLEEAITLSRAALDLHPTGHPDRSVSLNNLASCLCDRYNKLASIADLEEAITLARAALDLHPTDHPDRSVSLHNLASCLRDRYNKLASIADLEESITLGRAALDLRPTGHPDRSVLLHNLALYLSDRYDKLASIADLEEAITLGRAALELRFPSHYDCVSTLHNLADDLRRRFLKLGANTDLEEAVALHRSALDLRPIGHPDRLLSLNQLASCLALRFDKLEAQADLDHLITLGRAILDLQPPGHCNRAESVDNLLLYLRKRFERHDMTSDLDECITLQRVALGLCKPGDPDHATYLRHLVADLQNMLSTLESDSDIPLSSDHITFLHNLVICVRGIIDEEHASTNVDELITVARAALRLCPSDHSERITSLTTLAAYLQHRFQQQGAITDLDEAIMLYKETLECYPSGSPDNAPRLHKLACCLSKKFITLSIAKDLDDAIKFEHAASRLYLPGHPDRTKSLSHLTHCRQLRLKQRDAGLRPDCPPIPTGNIKIQQLIGNIVIDVLKTCPPRLLDAQSGVLCDRGAQMLHFENSQEYKQLVSSSLTFDIFTQSTHVREVVSTYFRYVTLSHRWANSEPLLRDIEKRLIYDLDSTDGLVKLSFFCIASYHHGYLWAWSDTCCIDKESSAELQEAIGSMFSWYRQSALTMVHLADVSDTGTLTSSEWFKRGWTLQELLAPRSLIFFTREWTPYRGISSNHKKNFTILCELTQVTGITSEHLSNFHPGVNDARARLQWASTRCTTRAEDIAYSLFGVFGFHLPVLYGENADNAVGRLLAEVISRSGDISILDWIGKPSEFHSCFPATLVPYQVAASQLSSLDFSAPPNMRNSGQSSILALVREMHQALSNLPVTQFVSIRLFLPCIAHRVEVFRTRTHISVASHVYRIQATGLKPIQITLSEPLQNTSTKALPYVLVRPWHPNFLDASVMDDDRSAYQWLARMQQPFSALLLEQVRPNEYRRVATFCSILACPTISDGALKGEVTTLTIV